VADASPVIAAAWFWHRWSETKYDELAGSLIAGHLIECSAYVTGGNFAGFDKYDLGNLVAPGFPIAEIAVDGTCVIAKHPGTGGFINVDTVRCHCTNFRGARILTVTLAPITRAYVLGMSGKIGV
jgi:hypothetical protein